MTKHTPGTQIVFSIIIVPDSVVFKNINLYNNLSTLVLLLSPFTDVETEAWGG